MCEAVPTLPNTPSRRGAQLKHRGNFTFTLHIILYFRNLYDRNEP
jgi:hypothetical protein